MNGVAKSGRLGFGVANSGRPTITDLFQKNKKKNNVEAGSLQPHLSWVNQIQPSQGSIQPPLLLPSGKLTYFVKKINEG